MELQGKIAVVAGASGGIGREISKALANEGVHVVLVARREGVLEALKREIESNGGRANVYLADLTDEGSVARMADFIGNNFDSVDLLFNTAGVGIYKKLKELTYDDWRKTFAVNVDSEFLLIRELLPLLEKSEKSYVISTGSGMGKVALSGRSAYCSSKFALRGMMLSFAKEYANSNIHFIHLTLGSVLTAFGPLSLEDKINKQKKGKKYLEPAWLAEHIVTKIKHDTLEPETPIYPRHYIEESRKDKR